MEDTGGEAVRDRRSRGGGGGGGTSDGVRTKACGWFDLSHVCNQPHLFAASWMWMERWSPLPPGPISLGPGRYILSGPAEILEYVSMVQAVIYITSCHFESSVHVQPSKLFGTASLGMGR